MKPPTFLSLIAIMMTAIPAAADPGMTVPDPAKGSVDSSGKFIPAGKAGKPADIPDDWKMAASGFIKETGPGTFRVGLVRCDRKSRTLTIPARVNAREGPMEYALVTTQGKVHESLLATDAEPIHIQMAALLLGLSPQPGTPGKTSVLIEVKWATNGPPKSLPLEELIALARGGPQDSGGKTMENGPWIFTGSTIDAQGFAAAREGSIISLIEDPAALIVNPRPGRLDDTLHVPNPDTLPVSGLPLSLTIRLQNVAKP